MTQLRAALSMFLALTLVTGIVYPLVVTAISQAVFPAQANGSLIVKDGKVLGSSLIGQPFDDPKYFWSRLSATATVGYNGAASSGANLGPLSDALLDAVRGRIDALEAADPGNTAPIPADLVTASSSGLDPHISPAAAHYQAARVARIRGIPEATVRALVAEHTQPRQLGILGEPGVNVVALNLALDARAAD